MRPLAERMRPQSLEDYVGQKHLIAPGAVIHQAILSGKVPSMILWGPPGVGKTTLAKLIAGQVKRPFHILSAIHSGVKDVREAIEKAQRQQFFDALGAILFIDEIHRFNKAQQDSLLGAVEQGIITLIGATTENPSFEVISALLSRCQVYTLQSLSNDDLMELVTRALAKDEYLCKRTIKIESYDALFHFAGGDARKLLNVLDLVTGASSETQSLVITDQMVQELVQQNIAMYDKSGEIHYDIASAFIKSIRGSDPNAAVYWLARMIEGGEDVKFIARRMVIAAAEDIGLANPNALLMATTAFQAVQAVGWPESRIILSQAVIYLANSPKSNSAYLAIKQSQELVQKTGNLPVPLHLRNAPTQLMKKLDYGKGYQYAHDFQGNFIEQEYLPEQIVGTKLYEPSDNTQESSSRQRLQQLWKEKYRY